jgi:hypothetical protein
MKNNTTWIGIKDAKERKKREDTGKHEWSPCLSADLEEERGFV